MPIVFIFFLRGLNVSTTMSVNFEQMSMQLNTSAQFLLRRLSTPSYIQEPGNALSTKWVWYWKDNDGWKKYAKTKVGTRGSLLNSRLKYSKVNDVHTKLITRFLVCHKQYKKKLIFFLLISLSTKNHPFSPFSYYSSPFACLWTSFRGFSRILFVIAPFDPFFIWNVDHLFSFFFPDIFNPCEFFFLS